MPTRRQCLRPVLSHRRITGRVHAVLPRVCLHDLRRGVVLLHREFCCPGACVRLWPSSGRGYLRSSRRVLCFEALLRLHGPHVRERLRFRDRVPPALLEELGLRDRLLQYNSRKLSGRALLQLREAG